MSNKTLSLKNIFSLFFSFKGKIQREPFIYGIILFYVIGLILVIPTIIYFGQELEKNSLNFFIGLVIFVIAVLGNYINLALIVKRLRDCNLSPWLSLLYFVLNIILVIYLAIKPSATDKTSSKT